jgi:hypothetical protein
MDLRSTKKSPDRIKPSGAVNLGGGAQTPRKQVVPRLRPSSAKAIKLQSGHLSYPPRATAQRDELDGRKNLRWPAC